MKRLLLVLLLLSTACGAGHSGDTPSKQPKAPTPNPAAHDAAPARSPDRAATTPPAPRGPSRLPSQPPIRAIDGPIEAAIAAGKLPGAVVAIGSRHRVHYLKAYGARALLPSREPMTVDTIFDLASLTKPLLTALAAMALVDAGKLTLEAPVGTYLPGFRRATTAGIRVADLLLHTAGLPRATPLRHFEAPKDAALRHLLDLSPARPQGRFHYGDTHYLILGALVEQVSGEGLDAYGKRHIAAPLGLTSTFFGRVPPSERARTAPTELREGKMIRGETHDPRAFRLGGTAGNAGMFSSGADLARLCQLLLAGGALDGVRLLSRSAVKQMTKPRRAGLAVRAYGWDVLSDYSRLRGERLSAQAYGHGGFTGTSVWVDPGRDLFVVFLSHRVHPEGKGRVLELVAQVTDAAVTHAPMAAAVPRPMRGRTLPGIDVALRDDALTAATALGQRTDGSPRRDGAGVHRDGAGVHRDGAGVHRDGAGVHRDGAGVHRVGAVVHRASLTREGEPTWVALERNHSVAVTHLMTPEHGLDSDAEGRLEGGRDRRTDLPITSLFGQHRRPPVSVLEDIDAILFDLQDAGVRFYTYMSTLNELLDVAAEHGKPLLVLDRPNPLGGELVEGPLQDRDVKSFVHYARLPIRHGMTAGELAQLLNARRAKPADLRVVWMEGYCRELSFPATGLRWTPPSPNLPNPLSVQAYPAVGLLEAANLSVGRGTDRPFLQIGAPWLVPERLIEALSPDHGLAMRPTEFVPGSGPFRGRAIPGVQLSQPARAGHGGRAPGPLVGQGLRLAAALHATHPAFALPRVHRMLGHRQTLAQLQRGRHVERPTGNHILELADFMAERARHLHYPSCFTGAP